MLKTKGEVLEDMYNEALTMVTDLEIQFAYFKTLDPKKIIRIDKAKFGSQSMNKEITVEMVIEEKKITLKEKNDILDIADKMLGVENDEMRKIGSNPSGSTS